VPITIRPIVIAQRDCIVIFAVMRASGDTSTFEPSNLEQRGQNVQTLHALNLRKVLVTVRFDVITVNSWK